ncbi:MAG: hypothetical protein WC445_04455 [Patescibacteria group bacterium]
MRAWEKEIDTKLVWIVSRWVFTCLGGGFLAAVVTLFMGMSLPYCVATGVVTLGGVAVTIIWKVSRRRYDDWYRVAWDVGLLTLVGSILLFFIGAYFGGVWWMVHGSVGGMIAAFFIILIGLRAFPGSEV